MENGISIQIQSKIGLIYKQIIMENKINIAELLKDCPKGMELNCVLFENATFEGIKHDEYPIIVKIKEPPMTLSLTKTGGWNLYNSAKCVIFPKGKTTWEGFVPPYEFKDGDILISGLNSCECNPFIFKQLNSFGNAECYCAINCYGELIFNSDNWTCIKGCRLATLKEKEKLFNTINEKGYKWNEETKTLEKLVKPKFNVEDVIQDKNGYKVKITNVDIEEECYGYESLTVNGIGCISFNRQDNWELVPNIKPRFKVGDRIKSIISSSYYTVVDIKNDQYFIKSDTEKYPYQVHFSNEINYKLVPNKFDTNTLVPFESRVLVRDSACSIWRPSIFGCIDKSDCSSGYYYVLGGICWRYCIPYIGNEHLRGTTDDCDEYYKNW